ncbi:hypothetical protein [Niabella hibiscisoli]|uniref:hypothetical protein n=1 Tax=Niabella hibiscisoli TaxID=1825928 RepID=UPI001F0D00BB|nr:hypothetical protein [Niabella hibiscisoli]MCH5718775.1 hypothetical protein [Niabella hibiscisoli]
MNLTTLFADKSIKAKAKTAQAGNWLMTGELTVHELLAFAETSNPTDKATCIEILELATRHKPELADESLLDFVTATLQEDEPRIKWESARVIGNIAKLFPSSLKQATLCLLVNATHSGTVVRWATALALAEILKLKTSDYKKLLQAVKALSTQEKDAGVQKNTRNL